MELIWHQVWDLAGTEGSPYALLLSCPPIMPSYHVLLSCPPIMSPLLTLVKACCSNASIIVIFDECGIARLMYLFTLVCCVATSGLSVQQKQNACFASELCGDTISDDAGSVLLGHCFCRPGVLAVGNCCKAFCHLEGLHPWWPYASFPAFAFCPAMQPCRALPCCALP